MRTRIRPRPRRKSAGPSFPGTVTRGGITTGTDQRIRRRLRLPTAITRDYSSAVLRAIISQYGPVLGDVRSIRFYDQGLGGTYGHVHELWRERWLGYTLPPGTKADDMPIDQARAIAARRDYAPRVDGVWSFPEYRLLYVYSEGHQCMESHDNHLEPLEGVLATDESDVIGFLRMIDQLEAERAREECEIHELGGSGRSWPLPDLGAAITAPILPGHLREDLLTDLDAFLLGKEWYARHHLAWRRGVLMYGPPGGGKTTVARMLAARAFERGGRAYSYTISASSTEAQIVGAVRSASWNPPALLVLEDLDAFDDRQISRSVLLNLLDGSAAREGLYVAATSNFPQRVDPALVGRAGRFDRAIEIPLPSDDLRHAYLERLWTDEGAEVLALTPLVVRETHGLAMATLNEVHRWVMLQNRDHGSPPSEHALREYISGLRRTDSAKSTGRWDSRHEGVGFRAVSSD